ncbi:MAG: dihydroorotase family protein [Acidobacteria bacterium]|nr:dihydroorotase family protein [Acidobacteriota bacterium]
MPDFDLLITNGQVHAPQGFVRATIGVRGEKIAALLEPSTPCSATEVVDAGGMWVFPGLIDLHAHMREPGYTHKEDFFTATQAAAAGGVTLVVDMPNVEPPTDTVERFLEKKRLAEQKCVVDWGHWVAGTRPEEIPRLAQAGATGFKIFQVKGAYPHDPRLAINDEGKLLECFAAIARTGLPCHVHPFHQRLFEHLSEEAWASGKPKNHVTFGEVYTDELVWKTAISTLLHLQKRTGVRLQVLHTHSAESLKLLKRAKADGQKVTVEIDPKYFHLTREDLERKGPRCCPGGFIVEDPERMRVIWESLSDGTIDHIGTDHAPHLVEELEKQRENAWDAAMGSPQLEHYLAVLLTDVRQGKIGLLPLIKLLTENPARHLGIYPRKGCIQVGSDADFAIVDLNREWTASSAGLYTKCGWSPYEGWRLKGKVLKTVLRGQVIMSEGRVLGQPGYGRYISGNPRPKT